MVKSEAGDPGSQDQNGNWPEKKWSFCPWIGRVYSAMNIKQLAKYGFVFEEYISAL